MQEYEIKLLGSKKELQKALNIFAAKTDPQTDPHTYKFSTYYYDSADILGKRGYSIRWRPKQNNRPQTMELKAMGGGIDGVSSRLELTESHENKLNAYFNLLSRADYPSDLPQLPYHTLNLIAEIETTRTEQMHVIPELGVKIESALDFIRYWNGEKSYGTEHELEFEIKEQNPDIRSIMQWFQDHVFKGLSVQLTLESKATRARQRMSK